MRYWSVGKNEMHVKVIEWHISFNQSYSLGLLAYFLGDWKLAKYEASYKSEYLKIQFWTFKGILESVFSKQTKKCLLVSRAKLGYDQAKRGVDMSWSNLSRSTSAAKLSLHVLLSFTIATFCLELIVFYVKCMVVLLAMQPTPVHQEPA